ncbi:MAG: molecular chaperone DnaK, partial [Nitrospira sp.]|nr:molecular chaperone DnaK [Nitrospira sp.]
HGDKIEETEKSNISGAVDALRKAMEGTDLEAIKTAMQNLTTASHKLAEEMYKKASTDASATGSGPDGGPGTTGGESAGSEEKVVDAEFEEVDKGKN